MRVLSGTTGYREQASLVGEDWPDVMVASGQRRMTILRPKGISVSTLIHSQHKMRNSRL